MAHGPPAAYIPTVQPGTATKSTLDRGAARARATELLNWSSVNQVWSATRKRCISGAVATAPPLDGRQVHHIGAWHDLSHRAAFEKPIGRKLQFLFHQFALDHGQYAAKALPGEEKAQNSARTGAGRGVCILALAAVQCAPRWLYHGFFGQVVGGEHAHQQKAGH